MLGVTRFKKCQLKGEKCLRPRISRREAKFVLDSLKRNKSDVEKKLELCQSKGKEIEKLNGQLQVYTCLIAKYDGLASGKKQRGRYQSGMDMDLVDFCLIMLGY